MKLHKRLVLAFVSLIIILAICPFWVIQFVGEVLTKVGDSVVNMDQPKWFIKLNKWAKQP